MALLCSKCGKPAAIGHSCTPWIQGVSNVSVMPSNDVQSEELDNLLNQFYQAGKNGDHPNNSNLHKSVLAYKSSIKEAIGEALANRDKTVKLTVGVVLTGDLGKKFIEYYDSYREFDQEPDRIQSLKTEGGK